MVVRRGFPQGNDRKGAFRPNRKPENSLVNQSTDSTDRVLSEADELYRTVYPQPLFPLSGRTGRDEGCQGGLSGAVSLCKGAGRYPRTGDDVSAACVPSAKAVTRYRRGKPEKGGDLEGLPGATTIFGSVYGTLGFCALDGSGNRIFITHGHDLNIDNEISISGSTVGKVVKRFYRSTTYPLDFSVVKVNSGIKISNQINSTSVRITNNISSDYTLKSYVGENIYLY